MGRKPYSELSEIELVRKLETHRRLAARAAAELMSRAGVLPEAECEREAE